MPSRNAIKTYLPNSYYHVYNRGVNKKLVFHEIDDYELFISFIDRYMSRKPHKMQKGGDYPNFYGELEVLAYCLMPNHFHLLLKTNLDGQVLAKFMQCLITSFTVHINKRHKRSGHLFQGRYRAVLQENQAQFQHISRYIHQNPRKLSQIDTYMHSSYRYYVRKCTDQPEWLMSQNILQYFSNTDEKARKEYKNFMATYDPYM